MVVNWNGTAASRKKEPIKWSPQLHTHRFLSPLRHISFSFSFFFFYSILFSINFRSFSFVVRYVTFFFISIPTIISITAHVRTTSTRKSLTKNEVKRIFFCVCSGSIHVFHSDFGFSCLGFVRSRGEMKWNKIVS